jgi:hypothetical protein
VAPEAVRPVAAALSSWEASVGGSDAGPIPTTPNFAPDPAAAGEDGGDVGGGAAGLAPVAAAPGVAGAELGGVDAGEGGGADGVDDEGGDAGAFSARAGRPPPAEATVAAKTSAVPRVEEGRGRITSAMLGRFERIVNNPPGGDACEGSRSEDPDWRPR